MQAKELVFAAFMVGAVIIIGTFLSPWKTVKADDPRLGPAVTVAGDPSVTGDTPVQEWHTWVVVKNTNSEPLDIAFQAYGMSKYHRDAVQPGEEVALRVGPKDVRFRFYTTDENVIRAGGQPPQVIDRLDEAALTEKYWGKGIRQL